MLYASDLLRFTVYRTDKGSLDKGGLPQPAFLNFDAALLYPVAHTMQVRLRGWSQLFPCQCLAGYSGSPDGSVA